MTYLKFSDFGAYVLHLKHHNITVSHLDIADVSGGDRYIFAVVATAIILGGNGVDSSTIAVCSEIALDQEPPNEPGEKVETPEQLEDWRAGEHKKMQKIMWGKLEKREKAIRSEGVKVQRGIYMGQPPEVLLRAK